MKMKMNVFLVNAISISIAAYFWYQEPNKILLVPRAVELAQLYLSLRVIIALLGIFHWIIWLFSRIFRVPETRK
jgi:flagellar biogenesis protein FliO